MSGILQCDQCGKPLALADKACPACGAAVDPVARRRLLLGRAEALAERGQFAEAARSLEDVLRQELEPAEAKLLWRKRGVWLLRSGRGDLLDAAEAALAEALRLDDADDLSHQLWIDLLVRRGTSEKAREWYRQRLALQPEDAMATRQLQVLKLSADFKAAPLPKLDLPAEGGKGIFYKLLKPSPTKRAGAALGLLFNGGLTIRALMAPSLAISGDPGSGADQLGSVVQLLNDPWLPGVQALMFAAYLIWSWKAARG